MGYQNPFANMGNSAPSGGGGGYKNPFAGMPSTNLPAGMSHPNFTLSAIPAPSASSTPSASSGGGGGGNWLSNIWNDTGIPYLYGKMVGGFEGFQTGGMDANGNPTSNDPLENLWQGIKGFGNGFANPDQASKAWNQQLANETKNEGKVGKFVSYTLGNSINDPLSYVPVGAVAKAVKLPEAFNLIKDATQATKAGQKVTDVIQPFKDTLGRGFVKNYGASDAVKQGLNDRANMQSFYNQAITHEMANLAKQHALTPDEMSQVPHVIEGTMPPQNPRILKAVADLKDAIENGVGSFKGQLGTKAELNTKINDQAILQKMRENYFPHVYNDKPEEIQQILEGTPQGSFSSSGPFNQSRQFATVQDALGAGLHPELNPYVAVAQRLQQSSKALTNAKLINDLLSKGAISAKEVPGMLKSNVLNSLKWLNQAGDKLKTTEEFPFGKPMIDVNPESGGKSFNPDSFSLPKILENSKPRYGSSEIAFNNPLDKAAYIAGSGKSQMDDAFMNALRQHTGLDDASIRHLGQVVRQTIKDHALNAGVDETKLTLPQILKTYAEKQFPNDVAATAEHPSLSDENNFSSLLGNMDDAQKAGKVSYFVNPNDEKALTEALNPYKEPNAFGQLLNKATGGWKWASLFNPMMHGHNIGYNGMYLGGANPLKVFSGMKDLKSGGFSDMYQRALKSGAISTPMGNLQDAVRNAVSKATSTPSTLGKIGDASKYATHGVLWDADKAIRTDLFRKFTEQGMSDADAAKQVNHYMVDYNNLTKVERGLSTVFPFYSWKKGNLPLQAEQWISNTPKQMLYEHMKNGLSQALSGQPMQDGKINTGIKLSDGSNVMLDPYAPSDDPLKVLRDGLGGYAFSSLNPIIKEAALQAENKKYYLPGVFTPQGKEGMNQNIHDAGTPNDFGQRMAHAVNQVNPLSGGALGQATDPSMFISSLFGAPTKGQPSPSLLQILAPLFGSFTSKDNPAMDDYYNKKDEQTRLQNLYKYDRANGIPLPDGLKQAAYAKIPYPGGH